MAKFKPLYTFTIPRQTEVDETTQTTDEAGQPISVTKKVKVEKEFSFALRKPTREEYDKGEFYYNKIVGQSIRDGLLPQASLMKRINNDGGVLSEEEKETWARQLNVKIEKENRFKELSSKEELSEDEKKEKETLLLEITSLNRQLQEIEYSQLALLDTTAESHARTKTIFWWLLLLLSKQEKDWEPVFKGENEKEREAAYDDFLDEEKHSVEEQTFLGRAVNKASQAIAFWYYSGISTQEEFDKAFDRVK